MLTKEGADILIKEVSIGKIEGGLKTFKKDKSHGPDGWPVEIFLEFFELIGRDLLDAMEFSRLSGRVTPSLNSTFLALFPKRINMSPLQILDPSLCVTWYTNSLQKSFPSG